MIKPGGDDFKENEAERIDNTGKAYNEFLLYYREHEIYFNPETCDILNKIIRNYYDTLWDYSYEHKTGFKNPKDYKEIIKKVNEEIPKVLESLKRDFREALTV